MRLLNQEIMDINGLKKAISDRIDEAYRQAFGQSCEQELTIGFPPDIKLGDFAVSFFSAAKVLGMSPAEIAKKVADNFSADEIVESTTAVGPYLNIKVKNNILFETVIFEIETEQENFGHCDFGKGKKVMVEYLSPNTNKPLHLGHARNGALGMAIANILAADGYDIKKAILVNDRGVHICKSMLAWKKWGEGETPESTGMKGDHLVGKYYVRYAQELEKNPELESEIHEMLQKWEAGDEEIIAIWKMMNDWVYRGYEKTYEEYGLQFDERFYESETYTLGKNIIEEGLEKKIFYKNTDGAVLYDLSEKEFGLDKDGQKKKTLLIRSDGTSVYMTQDIGTAVARAEKFQLDQLIYVVGNEQQFHFKVLFKILDSLGYAWAKNLCHLSYAMVNLPDGKMKSREGTVVDLDDLILKVKELVKVEIGKKDEAISIDEKDARARTIAVGAIKFQLLRVRPGQLITFDPKESIAIDGFTGPYCQYAYARICGILRNAEPRPNPLLAKERGNYKLLGNIDELSLVQKLIQYPEEIKRAAEELNPLRVVNAVYETAKAFNLFYNNNQVLGAGNPDLVRARLGLARSVAQVIRSGLGILGIEVLEKM
jgi:arginyl-tRNA synthetase